MKKIVSSLVIFLLLGNTVYGLAESRFDEEVEKEIQDPSNQYMFSKYAKTDNPDAMRLYKEGTYLINIIGHRKKEERLQEGVNRLKQALKLDPNFAAVHLSLGYAFIARSGLSAELKNERTLLEKAKAEFKKAVELDPKNADAHREVAESNYGWTSDDIKERIYHYKMALTIDPEQNVDAGDRADVADSLGKVDEVFHYLTQDLARIPVPERCAYVKTPSKISIERHGRGYYQKKYPKEYKAYVERVCRGEGMPEYEPPCEECGD